MSTRELPYTLHRSSATADIPILLANASRYQVLTDVSGYHCMANGHVASSVTRSVNEPLVTRRVNEGATVHAPSPISHGHHSASSSLTYRVTNAVSGRGPRNGNPTCQRGSYSTRPIAHQPRPASRSTSLTLRVTKSSLTYRVTIAWPTATAHHR